MHLEPFPLWLPRPLLELVQHQLPQQGQQLPAMPQPQVELLEPPPKQPAPMAIQPITVMVVPPQPAQQPMLSNQCLFLLVQPSSRQKWC